LLQAESTEGGVLFVDEAYALLVSQPGLNSCWFLTSLLFRSVQRKDKSGYGQEAILVIMDEMEKNTCVSVVWSCVCLFW
jgi:hypothetical protein